MRAASSLLRMAVDPAALMEAAGTVPDPWQADFLRAAADGRNPEGNGPFRGLLLTARQAGKSTTLSALAVWWSLVRPKGGDVLIVSRTLRQASEIIHKVRRIAATLGIPLSREAQTFVTLFNGGRIIALAGTGNIRGMSGSLVICDESAWVHDHVMTGSVLPMLAAIPGGGVLCCASTPAGPSGFFFSWWSNGGSMYSRWKVPYTEVPRLTEENVRALKSAMPSSVWAAEMLCSFEDSGGGVWLPSLVDQAFVPASSIPLELPTVPPIDWSTAA